MVRGQPDFVFGIEEGLDVAAEIVPFELEVGWAVALNNLTFAFFWVLQQL